MKSKLKDISFYIFLVLFISINCYCYLVDSFDEVWKYQCSNAIAMGYLPYKDINMIVTPLYYFLMSIGLNFNSSFLIFRIQEGIFWILFFVILSKIFKNFNKNRLIILFWFNCLIFDCPSIMIFDYNSLLLLISIIITYVYFFKENSIKKYFILGFLCGLGDLTKHTIGLLLCLVVFIFCLVENKKNIKIIMSFLIGVFIPNFIFLIYLLITNTFFNFFDLCLFGLNDFESGKNLSILAIFMFIFSIILLLISFIKYLKTKDSRILFAIFISLVLFILNYPIFDNMHAYQFFLYSIIFINFFKEDNYLIKHLIITFFTSFFAILFSINSVLTYNKKPIAEIENFSTIKTINNMSFIIEIGDIIKEKFKNNKVYIISAYSSFYSIYNNEYNGYLDLFIKGNIGSKEPIDYIENLDNFNDAYFLISKNYKEQMWQNFDNLSDYFKENFKLVDEISSKKSNEIFYVYKK